MGIQRLAAILAALGILLIAAGFVVRANADVAGEYMSRTFIEQSGLFDPREGNLWLGGGVAFLISAGAVFAASRRGEGR